VFSEPRTDGWESKGAFATGANFKSVLKMPLPI